MSLYKKSFRPKRKNTGQSLCFFRQKEKEIPIKLQKRTYYGFTEGKEKEEEQNRQNKTF